MLQTKYHNLKISQKITLTHSFLFILLQTILFSLILITLRIYYPYEAKKEIQHIKTEMISSFSSNNSIEDITSENFVTTIPSKYTVFFQISNSEHQTLAQYGVPTAVVSSEIFSDKIYSLKNDSSYLICYTGPLCLSSNVDTILQLSIDITQYMHFNTTLFVIVLLISVVGFFLSLFSGFIVSKIVLLPIAQITSAARKIDSKHLNERITRNEANDELSELTDTINDMISRLQLSFETQERLISDVSHDLKTPVSVLKGYASLLERWGKDDPEVLQESVSRIKKETDTLSLYIEDLLFLARKDNGSLILDKISFDMKEMIEEIAEDTHVYAPSSDVEIRKNESCCYFGDYRLLKQLFRILIDNSIKYADKPCHITVCSEFKKTNQKCQLLLISVQDNGCGIAKEDLPYLFDRFYRSDKSRNRNKGGSGLGLSIAKAIVESHEGSIKVESVLDEGTTMIIELPIPSTL